MAYPNGLHRGDDSFALKRYDRLTGIEQVRQRQREIENSVSLSHYTEHQQSFESQLVYYGSDGGSTVLPHFIVLSLDSLLD